MYAAGKKYMIFCQENGVLALPIMVQKLLSFVVSMSHQGLKYVLPVGSVSFPGDMRGKWSQSREHATAGAGIVWDQKREVMHPKMDLPHANTREPQEDAANLELRINKLEPSDAMGSMLHRVLWLPAFGRTDSYGKKRNFMSTSTSPSRPLQRTTHQIQRWCQYA